MHYEELSQTYIHTLNINVTDRIHKRNNMLNALGDHPGDRRMRLYYNALGKSIAIYAAPVWSTNASDSSFNKKQISQNAALRTVTGAHKMASIDHLHQESLTLKVKDHSDVISAHKETLHSRHHSTVLPRLGTNRKENLQNLHIHAVDRLFIS